MDILVIVLFHNDLGVLLVFVDLKTVAIYLQNKPEIVMSIPFGIHLSTVVMIHSFLCFSFRRLFLKYVFLYNALFL